MRATLLAIILIALLPLTASSDDQNLILEMEVEIAIREASKDVLKRAREQAREAMKKTSMYQRYEESNKRSSELFSKYKKISDTNRSSFSLEKEDELKISELVSSGYKEITPPKYRTASSRCRAIYGYVNDKSDSCWNAETDIISTMAGYSLCVIHSDTMLSRKRTCEDIRKKISKEYPKIKKYVDKEKVARQSEKAAWEAYEQESRASRSVRAEIIEIMNEFTWKIFSREMMERLRALDVEITDPMEKKIRKEFDSLIVST